MKTPISNLSPACLRNLLSLPPQIQDSRQSGPEPSQPRPRPRPHCMRSEEMMGEQEARWMRRFLHSLACRRPAADCPLGYGCAEAKWLLTKLLSSDGTGLHLPAACRLLLHYTSCQVSGVPEAWQPCTNHPDARRLFSMRHRTVNSLRVCMCRTKGAAFARVSTLKSPRLHRQRWPKAPAPRSLNMPMTTRPRPSS